MLSGWMLSEGWGDVKCGLGEPVIEYKEHNTHSLGPHFNFKLVLQQL